MKPENCISERLNKKIYRDGDRCIKLFDEVFSKADVLNEALNHARVEETGLNVPELFEVTRIDGKWAIVSQFIEGESLSELIASNPKKYDEYMEMFVELQLKIQSKSCPLLSRLTDKMNRKIDLSDLDDFARSARSCR